MEKKRNSHSPGDGNLPEIARVLAFLMDSHLRGNDYSSALNFGEYEFRDTLLRENSPYPQSALSSNMGLATLWQLTASQVPFPAQLHGSSAAQVTSL